MTRPCAGSIAEFTIDLVDGGPEILSGRRRFVPRGFRPRRMAALEDGTEASWSMTPPVP
jgi:hypothetical protein